MAEKATTNTEEGATELTGGTATFHGWKYSHYFLVVEENEKNLRAKCTLCGPSKKPLSTAHNTTSNFKKHLQTVHKTTTLVEKDPCKDGGDCSKKRRRDSQDVGEPSQQKRQCTIANKSIISATKVRGLISEYVIEDVAITTVYSGISSLQKVNRWYDFNTSTRPKIVHTTFRQSV